MSEEMRMLWELCVEEKLEKWTGKTFADCHTVTLSDVRKWYNEFMSVSDAAANIGEIEGFPLLENEQ